MEYDVIVVGGGIAGLTAAAYLVKSGYKTLLYEKESNVGGLVNSFDYKGFSFDGGIRSIENSGIVFPMLKELGIEVEFTKSRVTLGLVDEIIRVDDDNSLLEYQNMLINKFSENEDDIKNIMTEIKKIMKYMDILYGIDNPLFMDITKNKKYLFETILPWSLKFLLAINKINSLNEPVYDYLKKFTSNQALIDVIAQHFFTDTPTFFALSYFSLYRDYNYPLKGTGEITQQMASFILDHGGLIKKNTKVIKVDPINRRIFDDLGNSNSFKKMIWAADLKTLYASIDLNLINDNNLKEKISIRKNELNSLKGGNSILTLYLTTNLDKGYFKNICTEHLFYTPKLPGLTTVKLDELIISNINGKIIYTDDKDKIMQWLRRFFANTTYEISIPVLRNESLAPRGKSGLIISSLMEYSLVEHLAVNGWYDEFKLLANKLILNALEDSIFTGLSDGVIDSFVATPITIKKRSGNSDGAITGWAFDNKKIPVVTKMNQVRKSVLTEIPNILMAGQWSYSPSGLPISVMTGKIASDKVIKDLSNKKSD